MPTLIGRFNELLHNLSSSSSSSSSSTSAISTTTNYPHPSVRSSSTTRHNHTPSRSSSNRIASTSNSSSKRQIVKRSSSSRPQQCKSTLTTTINSTTNHNNNRHGSLITTGNNSRTSSTSNHNEQERDKTGNRHRASSCNKSGQQHHLSDYSSKITSKTNSNSQQQKQKSRQNNRQHQRRHSIASITSVSNNCNDKKSMATIKHIENNNNNNNNNKNIECKSDKPLLNSNHNVIVDESLASMLVRKMKIGAITRRNHNNNHQKTEIFHKKISKIIKKDVECDESDTTKGCFINHYLDGHLIKNHPDIISGKTCYDMPVKEIELLETNIIAACTGPNDGLLTINSSSKPFQVTFDDGIDFIDEDYPDSSLSSNGCSDHNSSPQNSAKLSSSSGISSTDAGDILTFSDSSTERRNQSSSSNNSAEEPVAGVENWKRFNDFAYGISTTLYETHPTTKQKAGDPIADSYAIVLRENSAIIALADGVNWGEKACLASRSAIHGCIDYLNKALYSAATDSTRSRNTMDIFIALLRSFNAAHSMILAQGGHLTTLCAAVICQLKDSDRFIVCTCNVGDSLAYVYSQTHGVREITQGSHDIFSMRDMRDALGALGPVSGSEPELNNLTVAMTIVDVGDIVFLTSDGISDNFDPVVGKFAIPKKEITKNCDINDNPITNNNNNNDIKSRKNTEIDTNGEKTSYIARRMKVRKIVQRSNSNPEKSSARYLNYTSKGLPLVSAQQRHELTLLRMEDLILNGVNGISNDDIDGDSSNHNNNNNNNSNNDMDKMITAKDLCLLMVDFSTKLTMAKRRILEDPELYTDDDNDINSDDVFDKQRRRRRIVGQKLAQLPGKLDHASIASIQVGYYGSLRKKKSHLYHSLSNDMKIKNNYNNNNNNNNKPSNNNKTKQEYSILEARYNLKMKATLARFESQDSLESINEAGPI